MPKITKENAQHFHQLAVAARRRNTLLRKQAQSIARQILTTNPHAHTKERIAVQLSMLHDCILNCLQGVERGAAKGARLRELIEAQSVLLAQADHVSGIKTDAEQLVGVLREDPEVALKGVEDAAKETVTGVRLSESDTVV